MRENEQATVEEVDVTPKVKLEKEKMVTVFIDPEMVTMQGIRINGKKYINEVTVPEMLAKDLLRIQAEFWETRKKLTDKNGFVRMKNDFQKEALFLADPKENASKKTWSRDYGLLGEREWNLCSDEFKKHLLSERKQYYGY